MAFRSEREADRRRIDLLESEVADKDAQLERLRAELAERDRAKGKRKNKKKRKDWQGGTEVPVPTLHDLPKGDVMDVANPDPRWWIGGICWLAVVVGVFADVGVRSGFTLDRAIPALLLGAPALLCFARRRIELDRKERTISVVSRMLFIHRAKVPIERGQPLVVEKRHRSKGRALGALLIGERVLARRRFGPTMKLAKRMASFMDMPLVEREQSSEDINRQALLPVKVVGAVLALIFGLGIVLKLLR